MPRSRERPELARLTFLDGEIALADIDFHAVWGGERYYVTNYSDRRGDGYRLLAWTDVAMHGRDVRLWRILLKKSRRQAEPIVR